MAGPAVSHCRGDGCSGPNQELVVRINGIDSGLMSLDLEAVLGRSHDFSEEGVAEGIPDSIMFPKCDSVEHLRQVRPELKVYLRVKGEVAL